MGPIQCFSNDSNHILSSGIVMRCIPSNIKLFGCHGLRMAAAMELRTVSSQVFTIYKLYIIYYEYVIYIYILSVIFSGCQENL